jgi:hypothetical protein
MCEGDAYAKRYWFSPERMVLRADEVTDSGSPDAWTLTREVAKVAKNGRAYWKASTGSETSWYLNQRLERFLEDTWQTLHPEDKPVPPERVRLSRMSAPWRD